MSTPASQSALDFADSVTVSTREAARSLCISRARLAELVLSGDLELLGPQTLDKGRVRVSDVDRLARQLLPRGGVRARTRPPSALLHRTHHAALHLLADWGSATKVSLQFALRQTYPSTIGLVNELTDRGLVQTVAGIVSLTEQGRQYVEAHPRVS
jgi:hypothetical protein